MPYRRNNYSFVIDASYQPYTFKELIQPFAIYKDAYEKQEAAMEDLMDKSDKFKYLSETLPEDSKARKIYENYANELTAQAQDLAKNGLSMRNRRSLTGLKQRYQGEIGRLVDADTAMQEERKLRRQLSAKDPSMLYATDNLNIDSFLDGETPNLYAISGTDLYTKGAAAGQSASKRIFSAGDAGSTLGGYYRDYVSKLGYDPSQLNQWQKEMLMNDFTQQVSVLPELQQAANQILEANGVNQNLKGDNLRKAQQQVIRGIVDGAVYSEDHKPVRDEGVMSAGQEAQLNMQAAIHGMTKDANGRYISQDEWMYTHDDSGKRTGYSTEYIDAVKKGLVPGKNVKMGADGKTPTVTSNNKEGNKRKPKGDMFFQSSVGQSITKKDRRMGKQISYGDAVQKEPNISLYVGEDSDLYDYWYDESTEGVYVIGHADMSTNEGESQHNGI